MIELCWLYNQQDLQMRRIPPRVCPASYLPTCLCGRSCHVEISPLVIPTHLLPPYSNTTSFNPLPPAYPATSHRSWMCLQTRAAVASASTPACALLIRRVVRTWTLPDSWQRHALVGQVRESVRVNEEGERSEIVWDRL